MCLVFDLVIGDVAGVADRGPAQLAADTLRADRARRRLLLAHPAHPVEPPRRTTNDAALRPAGRAAGGARRLPRCQQTPRTVLLQKTKRQDKGQRKQEGRQEIVSLDEVDVFILRWIQLCIFLPHDKHFIPRTRVTVCDVSGRD